MRAAAAMLVMSVRLTASCAKPQRAVEVTELELLQSSISLKADAPQRAELTARVVPEQAPITWKSADEAVAHADASGNIYPCGVRLTEIRDFAGERQSSCSVSVSANAMGDIPEKRTDYPLTLYDMVMEQMKTVPVKVDTGADGKRSSFSLHDEEVEGFANPANFLSGRSKYQFLTLDSQNGISAEALDAYLDGKGVLEGRGAVFKSAAEKNNISEVFLVTFACLQTENGTAQAACGMQMKGKTVYSVYGADDDTVREDSLAYDKGWFGIEEAIEGGAALLSEKYIHGRYGQNTLYKMRWDPVSPGTNQYTTDVEWADRIARRIGAMTEAFPTAAWSYDIPVFEKGRAVAG